MLNDSRFTRNITQALCQIYETLALSVRRSAKADKPDFCCRIKAVTPSASRKNHCWDRDMSLEWKSKLIEFFVVHWHLQEKNFFSKTPHFWIQTSQSERNPRWPVEVIVFFGPCEILCDYYELSSKLKLRKTIIETSFKSEVLKQRPKRNTQWFFLFSALLESSIYIENRSLDLMLIFF